MDFNILELLRRLDLKKISGLTQFTCKKDYEKSKYKEF